MELLLRFFYLILSFHKDKSEFFIKEPVSYHDQSIQNNNKYDFKILS